VTPSQKKSDGRKKKTHGKKGEGRESISIAWRNPVGQAGDLKEEGCSRENGSALPRGGLRGGDKMDVYYSDTSSSKGEAYPDEEHSGENRTARLELRQGRGEGIPRIETPYRRVEEEPGARGEDGRDLSTKECREKERVGFDRGRRGGSPGGRGNPRREKSAEIGPAFSQEGKKPSSP